VSSGEYAITPNILMYYKIMSVELMQFQSKSARKLKRRIGWRGIFWEIALWNLIQGQTVCFLRWRGKVMNRTGK